MGASPSGAVVPVGKQPVVLSLLRVLEQWVPSVLAEVGMGMSPVLPPPCPRPGPLHTPCPRFAGGAGSSRSASSRGDI